MVLDIKCNFNTFLYIKWVLFSYSSPLTQEPEEIKCACHHKFPVGLPHTFGCLASTFKIGTSIFINTLLPLMLPFNFLLSKGPVSLQLSRLTYWACPGLDTSRASLAFLGTQISQFPQRLLHPPELSTRHTFRRKPHHELISPGQNPQSLTEWNGITGQLALWGVRVSVRWDVKDVRPQIPVSLHQGEMALTGSPSSTTAPVLVWSSAEGGSGAALAASP